VQHQEVDVYHEECAWGLEEGVNGEEVGTSGGFREGGPRANEEGSV